MEMIVSLRGERAALCLNARLWELTPGWDGLAWGYCARMQHKEDSHVH